jgi:exonuclease SbcC
VKRVELADLQARIAELDTEWIAWQQLCKMLSRDGLPVLEIDAAGPAVTSYMNDFLNVCYGPRFTGELITQQAKADGKGLKETFDLLVFDNKRGGEQRAVSLLSGGEKIIVSEALMNAIALYMNTRSPQPIRTCWRDETTGPLSAANCARYVAMLRRVHQLGGFHHTFFVTHNPEAAAMADAQIRIADGKATIVEPPYSEAA